MSDAWLLAASYVVHASWQLPLLGAAGWGLSRWVRRTGPELPHKIWVAVLALATLAPAGPIFRAYLGHQASPGRIDAALLPEFTPVVAGSDSFGSSHLVLPATAIYLIAGLYLVSVAFFSFRLCRGIRSAASLVRNAGPALLEPDHLAAWRESQDRFSVGTASLLCSDEISCPVTAGFRHPVLLLPTAFAGNHSRTEFLAALGHECAHMRRADFAKNLVYEAAALLTSFHPATWFIKSQIAQTREMVCDRMAAERLLGRRAYGESLLRLAAKMPLAAAAVPGAMGIFDANILERRIMTMMTSLPHVSRIRRSAFAGVAILVLCVCAGSIGSFTQPVRAQSPSPKKQESTPDLSCTYYESGKPSPGTCAADPEDKTRYRCISNTEPRKSQTQIGCEWKVQRAAGKKK